MAASVVRKTSIVAMFGWIMPLPLAIAPMRHSLPPSRKRSASSLRRVSVVMMPSAASPLPSGESAATSAGMPAAIGAIGRGCPMTPVEATSTSCACSPSACAVSSHICSAMSMPSALQVFALPLLQISAWALPSARCALVTVSGAPFTRLVVYTAAVCAGTSL